MRRSRFIPLLFALALTAATGPALGAIASATDGEPVSVLSQSALVQWADAEQRLVIETTFTGRGTNFLWIVALPAVPVVEPVSPGLFPTLRRVFQPQVVHRVRPWWLVLGLAAVGTAVGARWALRTARPNLALTALFGGCFALAVLGKWAMSEDPESEVPTGGVREAFPPAPSTHLTLYETTALETTDVPGLNAWLGSNGFGLSPTTAEKLIGALDRSRVLVAVKGRRAVSHDEPDRFPPLSFSFRTREAVYPVPPAGSDDAPCAVDLFVFGPARATASSLTTRRCSKPDYGDRRPLPSPRLAGGGLRIRHPELKRLAGASPIATRLRGRLAPAPADTELRLRWYDFEPGGERRHTWSAAAQLAGNVTAFSLLGSALILLGLRGRGMKAENLSRLVNRLILAATGIGLMTFWMIPKVSQEDLVARSTSLPFVRQAAAEVCTALQHHLDQLRDLGTAEGVDRTTAEASLRAFFGSGLARAVELEHNQNVFDGEPVRLEDSPGNYSLERSESGFTLYWHDADGAIADWPEPFTLRRPAPETGNR